MFVSVYENSSGVRMDSVTSSLAFLLCMVYTVFADCPSGWEKHDTGCYKILGLEASWAEAKMYCRFMGSELAIVDSAAEETAIEGMLARFHGAHIDEYYWISGTDMVNEGQFMWFAGDGQRTPISGYTNWAPGSPDNAGGQQNCLMIHYRGTRTSWLDANCGGMHSFVCELSSGTGGTDLFTEGPAVVG